MKITLINSPNPRSSERQSRGSFSR
jgi:hypothetical protein